MAIPPIEQDKDDGQDVAGPILFYDVNDDGEEISLTAQEIYAIRLAVESRTVILTEKGRKLAAISID